jgi:4-hydroxy-tetrahydrodipicolinate synthase
MQAKSGLSGVIAPVLTPFGENGAPDAERFLSHARWLLADGCHALAPFGTTSEANSLGLDERMELLEDLIDGGIEPGKLMPGTGACALSDAITLTQHAVELGCAGVLMLPPFYYKQPSEEGLFRFFAEVIEGVADERLKIYLYHIPPVAQVGFAPSLVARLVEAFPDTIAGLKDSSGDWSNTEALLTAHPQLRIFPGSEVFLLAAVRKGAAGCISATANVNAGAIRLLWEEREGSQGERLQESVAALRRALQAWPMIPVLKALIAYYRRDPGWARVRPPFVPLPAAEAEKAVRLMADVHGLKPALAEVA